MRHNEIVSAKSCAFIMFSSANKTNQQLSISQLCAVFMVNTLALPMRLGVLLNEMTTAIRDTLKNIDSYVKAPRHVALAIARHPSKLRRYGFLAEINNDLYFRNTRLTNQNKRGTEA